MRKAVISLCSTALGIGARKTAMFTLHMLVTLLCFHFVSCDSGRGYDFTIQETGLQLDQPPVIGNVSVVQIIIMENDNVEGVIEFDPKYTAISGKLLYALFCLITKYPYIKDYFQLLLGSLASLYFARRIIDV